MKIFLYMRAINSFIHLIKMSLERALTRMFRGDSGDGNGDEEPIKIKIPLGELLFSSVLILINTYGFVIEPETLPKNIYDKLETLENIQPQEYDLVAFFNLIRRRQIMDKYPNSYFHHEKWEVKFREKQ